MAAPRRNESVPLPALPARDPSGHKGTFGTVAVIGGCSAGAVRMIGAPALAATGALRAGCGLTKVFAPAPILPAVLGLVPSATGYAIGIDTTGAVTSGEGHRAAEEALRAADVLVIGPGLGRGPGPAAAVLRAIDQDEVPLVIDADALHILAAFQDPEAAVRAPAVLTPHPGEFRVLAKALGIEADPIDDATRPEAASSLANKLRCTVVLKGARTVVSDGSRVYINATGSSALATGGTGDVLSGVIAGLVAQFVARGGADSTQRPLTLFDAACLGVHVHGLAGEHAAAQAGGDGILAAEVAAAVPGAMAAVRSGG